MVDVKKAYDFYFFKIIGFILSVFTVPLYVSGKMILPVLYGNAEQNNNFKNFNKTYTIIGYVIFSLGIISNASLYPTSFIYTSIICFLILDILHFIIGIFFLMGYAKKTTDTKQNILIEDDIINQSDEIKQDNIAINCERLDIISKIFYLIISVLMGPLFNACKYFFKDFYDEARSNENCKRFIDVYSIVGFVLFGLPLSWMNVSRLISFGGITEMPYFFFGLNILHFVIGIIVMNAHVKKDNKEIKVADSKSIATFFSNVFSILGIGVTIYTISLPFAGLDYYFIISFVGIALTGVGFLIAKLTNAETKYALLALILSVGTFISIIVFLFIILRLVVVI